MLIAFEDLSRLVDHVTDVSCHDRLRSQVRPDP